MGDFYQEPHFTMVNFKFWDAAEWGLKIFGPKYQKAHPYAKSGRINRLVYYPRIYDQLEVAVFKR